MAPFSEEAPGWFTVGSFLLGVAGLLAVATSIPFVIWVSRTYPHELRRLPAWRRYLTLGTTRYVKALFGGQLDETHANRGLRLALASCICMVALLAVVAGGILFVGVITG